MKQAMPYVVALLFIFVFAGVFWYFRSLYLVQAEVVVQPTKSVLSTKTITDATTSAKALTATLQKHGNVPLTADLLPKNPKPLFGSVSE